jgi:WD40 repeat protein
MDSKSSEAIGKDEIVSANLTFRLKRVIQEEHKPSMVYCVRYCDINSSFSSYFASVGGNSALIYHIGDSCNVSLVQGYLDEDMEEVLYACAWAASSKVSASVILVIAGLRGILKCINCLTYEIDMVLLGHGNAVNDLRVHPTNPNLVLSASKDESVRLWNIDTGVCIAVFSGEKGHRDEVLSLDPHPLGNCFCTGGMDTSIKIWGLEEDRIQEAIERSYHSPRRPGNLPFEPVSVQIPLFSTTQVHSDYVDSVRWYGNCILSKSTKNRVALWTPDSDRYKVIIQFYSANLATFNLMSSIGSAVSSARVHNRGEQSMVCANGYVCAFRYLGCGEQGWPCLHLLLIIAIRRDETCQATGAESQQSHIIFLLSSSVLLLRPDCIFKQPIKRERPICDFRAI